MEVENRKTAVNGSNALKAAARPLPKERVKNPEIDRQRKEERRKARKVKILKFLKFNGSIVAAGVVGLTIVGRYGSIYADQKEIISLQEKIHVMNEESEAISVKLLKYDNIAYIEEVATKELNMIKPKSGAAVYVDMQEVEPAAAENNETQKGENLFSKIKELLFN
ncbi:MAG: hypothetical protein RR844_07450 [Clostridium sp.]